MESRFAKALSFFVVILCHNFWSANSELVSCDRNETCGENSQCINKECICNDGFTSLVKPVGEKGKNCVDKKCENGKCYTCLDDTRCKRCIHFVTEGTGKCTDECKTEVVFKRTAEYEGEICKAPEESKWTKEQLTGLIVGLSVAVILIIVAGVIIVVIRKKKTDEDTRRQIEEIRARKKRDKEERRKARHAAKYGNTQEGNSSTVPENAARESSGNIRGGKDFEV